MTASSTSARGERALLNRIYLSPPEGVPIPFTIASLAARIYAQVVDVLLTQLLLLLVLLACLAIFGFGTYLWIVASLGYFFLRVPYYVLSEIAWNGATLGKRLTGLRVVDAAGGPLTLHALTVRNLLREAEVFFPGALAVGVGGMVGWERWLAVAWICVAFAIPSLNRRRQRLGDMIAGTMVILRPQAVLLPDVAIDRPGARRSADEPFGFSSTQLDHYGAYELQTLEGLVRQIDEHRARGTQPSKQMAKEVNEVSAAIRAKIIYGAPVELDEHAHFLSDFYRAQRRYLEEKQLFGDARADKFHAQDAADKP